MIQNRLRFCALLALSCAPLLAGCGSSSSTPPSTTTAAFSSSALAGSWLITPTMPLLEHPGTAASGFSLAVTLDTTSTGVSGAGASATLCQGFGSGGTWGFQTSTFDSEGNFVLQPPSTSGLPATAYNWTVIGKAPAVAGQSWSGVLTLTSSAACPAPETLSFTATPISPVAGIYKGNVTLYDSNNVPYTGTMTAKLQQGGNDAVTGVFSNTVLSGTVQFTGVPCLSAETFSTGGRLSSGIQGNLLLLNLSSADGGAALSSGWVADTAATTLDLDIMRISVTGSCTSAYIVQLPVLTRQ